MTETENLKDENLKLKEIIMHLEDNVIMSSGLQELYMSVLENVPEEGYWPE